MKRGFTMLELLIVIAIIGVMSTLAIVGLTGAQAHARDGRRKSDLETVRSALELYRADCDRYPPAGNSSGSFSFTAGSNFKLTGTNSSSTARCSRSTTYLNLVPSDPTSSGRYLYSVAADGSTYSLCSYLELHAGMSVVSCGGTQCGTSSSYSCYYQAISP